MAIEKEPWLKFWVGDWLGDLKLRRCSSAAKGLWIDMLCIMHQDGSPYGHLAVELEQPLPVKELASYCGRQIAETNKLLAELEQRQIFSRTQKGVIFSRKMVRDERKRSVLSQNGKAGAKATWYGNLPEQKAISRQGKSDGPIASSLLLIASEESTGEKNAPGDDHEPVIPTVQEIIAYGNGAAAIPEDFCVYYHAVCTEKQRWVGAFGRALLWRKEIVRWWTDRRAGWKKTAAPDEKKTARDEIEAELQWQKDPARLAELRKLSMAT